MGDKGMSILIAGAIFGAGLLASLLVAVSEKLRNNMRRRRESVRVAGMQPHFPLAAAKAISEPRAVPALSPELRAAAYQEILDALGDDLDEEIVEWEAVLDEFPQVIGAEELLDRRQPACEPIAETTEMPASDQRVFSEKKFTAPNRTRRIIAEERGMILRLMKTGFAPEEIALWLNLPLERVQEFLPLD